ncbi:MAG: hypothetical protein CML56_10415 [Rhodobacteraceae bacterium]|nr:hypothetical protein [Paracoccaceae bacterium]
MTAGMSRFDSCKDTIAFPAVPLREVHIHPVMLIAGHLLIEVGARATVGDSGRIVGSFARWLLG